MTELREQIEADLIEIIGVPDRALARALTTVALKAIEKSGRTIVPLEPTEEMCNAACGTEAMKLVNGMIAIAANHGMTLPPEYHHPETPLVRWYRAMLAARPRDAAPAEESDGV